jgi:2-polyprenyl-3-methyl-5-hydroxy-6-metoxy-1,4-benzoquinol methylase
MENSEKKEKNKYNKIDKLFYDESSYFEDKITTFVDLENPFQKYRVSKVLEIYTPEKNEKVLDLGCGWGTFCFALAPLCKDITGLDYSSKSINLCKEFLSKSQHNNIKFICSDATNTKLESVSYDVIISADLFEHLYPVDFEKVLDESKRLLKINGKIVIWTPHKGHILEILKNNNIILKKDISHVDYKSMAQILKALKKRKFLIRKSYYTESHLPVFRIIEKLLLRFVPILRRRIAILAEKQSD